MVANSLDTPRATDMAPRADDLRVWVSAMYGFRAGVGAVLHHSTLFCLTGFSTLLLGGVALLTIYIESFLATTSGLPRILLILGRLGVAWGLPAFILTPLGVCLYRQLLLDERPAMRSFGVAVRERRGMRYLRVSLLVAGLYAVAEGAPVAAHSLIYGATLYADEADITVTTLFLSISVVLGYVAAFIASLRLALAYPAAAVGNTTYTLRQSNIDMRGITWRLFLVYALLSLPFILAIAAWIVVSATDGTIVVSGTDDTLRQEDTWGKYGYLLLFALGQLLFIVASIAATARLYERRVAGEASRIADVFA